MQTQLPCFQKLVLHHTATAELSKKKSRGLAFQAGPEFIRVYQDRINCPELLLNSGLSPSFWHLFAPVTLAIAFEFIHFALRQLQYSPKTFVMGEPQNSEKIVR
ncbi:hypothetical protein APU03_29490 [Klebsiella pneumoniae]|nr:hypothetical protein AN412_21410 [Klebsiella pneumoniae]KSY34487.1 hypothetical protein APU03_29490 [Klebsiella pneumoniae]OKB31304.1 hypothetical protein A9F12_03110 [Klebsiella pneumoniae]